jgi:hypothetical protein
MKKKESEREEERETGKNRNIMLCSPTSPHRLYELDWGKFVKEINECIYSR